MNIKVAAYVMAYLRYNTKPRKRNRDQYKNPLIVSGGWAVEESNMHAFSRI